MSLPEYLLIALCAVYLLYLAGEKLLLSRCRSSFVHVIHVNGIRGKSSTVRLIDAGLRGGGVRVLSKSTGTLPMILHVDGREEQIERRAPANIREQRDMMRLARREGAQVLVVECMAIHPEGQRASEDMLRADLAVVTNVRPDHTDVMGETREEICDALLSMRPHKGDLFTCEADMAPRMEKAMAGRGRVFVIEPRPEGYPVVDDFGENVALAGSFFGNVPLVFAFEDGAMVASLGEGDAAVTLSLRLQQDGVLRLTLETNGEASDPVTFYLWPQTPANAELPEG